MDDVLAWRRLPAGAEVAPQGGVHFRVWAPKRSRVAAVFENPGGEPGEPGEAVELDGEGDGYFSGFAERAAAGSLYRYRLDGEQGRYHDPVSRFQPSGPHGPSEVIDPTTFAWTQKPRGLARAGQVAYELHVGTFTPEGTYEAAAARLGWLRDMGITVVELMPIADFPGRFGWGYDGVNLFAPMRMYGRPDALRAFVDAAHGLGIGVILDVVYNHLGPDGNYLGQYSDTYMSSRHFSEWGDTLNYDGPGADHPRQYVALNARYWIDEFRLDGLRLDATQQIFDDTDCPVLAEVTRAAREAANGRPVFLAAENEPQDVRLLRAPAERGCDIDALWNDDFHHAAAVALTSRSEAYKKDYRGSAQEFVSGAKYGFLFQGQRYDWQIRRRGTATFGFGGERFINYLDNHDQVANAPHGARSHQLASPGKHRALTALLLLGPQTPLLFQGQEFAASAPFVYFADHDAALAEKVESGRADFLAQFPSLASPEMRATVPPPADPATFARCKLDWNERETHRWAVALHQDLLRLRREDPVLRRACELHLDGAVLSRDAFVLRYFGPGGDDRLLVVNLGRDMSFVPAPEPLLAPPAGQLWRTRWCSEHPNYEGQGATDPEIQGRWQLPGETAWLLGPAA